jgi:addiction module RelE/StbE family toxin
VKVVWLRRADRHLEAIADRIAQDSPVAAYAMTMRIRRAGSSLAEMPHVGRSGRVAGTRELVIVGTPYLIAYRVRETEIQILSVLHGRQQWPHVL